MSRWAVGTFVVVAALASVWAAPASGAVRLGLEAGLNQSGVTYRSDFFDHEFGFRPAWSAGLTAEIPMPARLSLNTGLRYIEYGDLWDLEFEDIYATTRVSTHQVWTYLSLPVIVRVRPIAGRGFFLGAGPELGYLLRVWQEATFTPEVHAVGPIALAGGRAGRGTSPLANIFEDVGTFDNPTRYHYRWNVSLGGVLGHEFAMAGHTAEVQARYTHGLTDIVKSGALARKTRGLEVLLGMRW